LVNEFLPWSALAGRDRAADQGADRHAFGAAGIFGEVRGRVQSQRCGRRDNPARRVVTCANFMQGGAQIQLELVATNS